MSDKTETLDLYFPLKGIDLSVAYKNQIPLTSPIITNCRIKDVAENMGRGGQRPGMRKVFDEQAGDDHPVIKIVVCTNTYIVPSE